MIIIIIELIFNALQILPYCGGNVESYPMQNLLRNIWFIK